MNTDDRAVKFKERLIHLMTEQKERAEDIKELMLEAKGVGLLKEEMAGIKLAAKRYFETQEKKQFRESVESFAESLGDFADSPLGQSAVLRFAQ